jgi:ribosome-binding ATPase YchF (GTP1/OBG family)
MSFSVGYGSTSAVVAKFMDKLGIKEPLDTWDDAMVGKVVDGFLDERFPTVVALNKIDMADADKNITKIMRKYDPVCYESEYLNSTNPNSNLSICTRTLWF